jgi:hypothetical protein
MKKLLRALGGIVFLALLFVVGSVAYSSWRGYTRWYFRVNGQVVVNGQQTTGYLHANTDKTLLILTRTDDTRPESYLASLGAEKAVIDCGEWHPIRFLPFPVGHVNPPCSFFIDDRVQAHDPPITRTLERGPHFIEFSTASGKKVRGQW